MYHPHSHNRHLISGSSWLLVFGFLFLLNPLCSWVDTVASPVLSVNPGYILNKPVVSPDGSMFVTLSGSSPYVAETWNINTGAKITTFSGHTSGL